MLIGDDAQRNRNANHSDVNSQPKNSTPKKKVAEPPAKLLDTSQSSNLNKPSKIPKFKKPNGISCSSNETKSNGSLANSNDSAELGTKSTRFKYLSTASKIPQRQTHQSQSSNSQLNTSANSSSSSAPNYNTYVKKSKTQKSTTPLVNSATFDKAKTTTSVASAPKQTKSSAPASKPAAASRNGSNKSETKLISTKNIEIVVVPAAKLNKTKPNSQKSIPAGSQVVVKLKDDEGYSTMSSELMQQLKLNTNTKIELCPSIATNSCTSTSSSTNNESHDKNDDSGIRISRVSGDSSNITSDESARTSSSSNHSPRLEAHQP